VEIYRASLDGKERVKLEGIIPSFKNQGQKNRLGGWRFISGVLTIKHAVVAGDAGKTVPARGKADISRRRQTLVQVGGAIRSSQLGPDVRQGTSKPPRATNPLRIKAKDRARRG